MKDRGWAYGARGELRRCGSCHLSVNGAPGSKCVEREHVALYEKRRLAAAAQREAEAAYRKANSLSQADVRKNKTSIRGRTVEPDLPGELWRPFGGIYQVSNLGRVRGRWKWLMRQQTNRDGYPVVTVVLGGRKVTIRVHVIVCEAFHGHRPDGMEVAHQDGTRNNNRSDNLRWASPAENAADKRRHGTLFFGETAPNAKLNSQKVIQLRADYRSGLNLREIGKIYGISPSHACSVARGRSWSHLPI